MLIIIKMTIIYFYFYNPQVHQCTVQLLLPHYKSDEFHDRLVEYWYNPQETLGLRTKRRQYDGERNSEGNDSEDIHTIDVCDGRNPFDGAILTFE